MKNIFKDNFNYLGAFLAVLLGLTVFKDNADQSKLNLFGLELSLLELAVPFVLIMTIAMYFAALAMWSKNVKFEALPLTRVLESISNILATFALLYPIGVATVWLLSKVINYLFSPPSDYEAEIFIFVSFAVSVITVIYSGLLTSHKVLESNELKLMSLYKSINVSKKEIEKDRPTTYELVEQFNKFLMVSKNALNILGYGASISNVSYIVDILLKKSVLNEKDRKTVESIESLRNSIIHDNFTLSVEEIRKYQSQLVKLIDKLDKIEPK